MGQTGRLGNNKNSAFNLLSNTDLIDDEFMADYIKNKPEKLYYKLNEFA